MSADRYIRKFDTKLSDFLKIIKPLKTRKKNLAIWIIISIAYFLLILCYWAPFSWNSLPHLDLWDIGFYQFKFFHLSDLFKVIYTFFQGRPYVYAIYHFGPLISSDSFIGYNIVLATMLFLKSLFTFAFAKRILKENIQIAFLAGALSPIWPGESRIFELDYSAYHFGSLLILIAIYLLICYWQKPKLYLFIIAIYSLLWSLAIYEHAILIALIAPLIIIILEKKISKRVIVVTVIWWIPPFLKLISTVIEMLFNNTQRSYELGMLDLSSPISTLFNTIKFCYESNFTSWIGRIFDLINIYHRFKSEILLYSLIGGFLIGGFLLLIFTFQMDRDSQIIASSFVSSMKKYGFLLLFCLSSIYVTYFLFAATTKRFLTTRTFIYSSVWAAISVAIFVLILSQLPKSQFWKQIIIIFAAILISSSAIFCALLNRASINDYEINFMGDGLPIIRKIPTIKQNTVVIIIDNTPKKSGFKRRQSNRLVSRIVSYVYNDYNIRAFICRQDDPELTCNFTNEFL